MENSFGNVRVSLMYSGLQPIYLFDAVEMEEMTFDPVNPAEMVMAIDYPDQLVTGYSIRLHFRAGGVDTVTDFPFDPISNHGKDEAEQHARQLAFSLSDMIRMHDPSLALNYVLGNELAADPLAFNTIEACEDAISP